MKFTARGTIFVTALLLGFHRSSAQDSCTPCDDKPTPAMEDKGKKCEDFPNAILSKCRDADNWVENKFCRYTCSVNDRGYDDEEDCCTDGPSNAAETGVGSNDETGVGISNDDCSPNPCENGGTCQDDINAYTCTCPAGYSGDNCETNINDCSPGLCQNGGTCVDGINTYTCTCPAGYSGDNCETNINDCSPGLCQNGGTCVDGINSYTCTCPAGYSGDNCEVNINECASSPCQNGGTCVDGVNSYTCTCAAGYSGDNCETNINECASSPCQNGGTCQDGIDTYTCNCPIGYSGTNCETSAPVTKYMYICDKKFQSEETICAEGTETCESCDKKGEQCWVASCGGGGGQTAATTAAGDEEEIADVDDGNASDSVDSDSNGTEQASVGVDAATQNAASFSFLYRNRRQKKRRNLRRGDRRLQQK